MKGRTNRLGVHAAAIAGYLALAAAMTYPVVRNFSSAIPGDSFDGWQNYWNLWWTKIALLVEHRSPFFSDMIYYPTGVDLHFHTLNILNGFWSLPIQLVWGLMVAYNAVVFLTFVLGGYGAFLLALYALGRAGSNADYGAAFVAGLIYAFSPFHFAHLLGHMQVISIEWLPFFTLAFLLAVDRASDGRRWLLQGTVAGVFLAVIGLCNWYYLFYSMIFALIALAWKYALYRRAEALAAGVFSLFVGMLILSPVLVPMVLESLRYRFMVPDPAQSIRFSADLLAFFTPNEFHPIWGRTVLRWANAHFTASLSEHMVFAGYTVLALAAIGLTKVRKSRRARSESAFWGVITLTFFVFALGPVLHVAGRTKLLPGGGRIPLPYALVYRLPIVRISRSVSRFDVMVMLGLAVLAAMGLVYLARSLSRRGWLYAVASALILFEFLPVPYPVSPPDTPSWYFKLASEPGDFAVLNLPMSFDRPGYLLYQTVHGKRLTVAYISREDPRTLVDRAPLLQEFRHLRMDVLSHDLNGKAFPVLDYLGVRYVVVDGYKMPGGKEKAFTESLVQKIFAGRNPVYKDRRLTVYRVPKSFRKRPFVILGIGWSGPRLGDGSVYRTPPNPAELVVVAPREERASLHLAGLAGKDFLVEASCCGTIWKQQVAAGDFRMVLPPMAVKSGENRLQLRFDGGVPEIRSIWVEER